MGLMNRRRRSPSTCSSDDGELSSSSHHAKSYLLGLTEESSSAGTESKEKEAGTNRRPRTSSNEDCALSSSPARSYLLGLTTEMESTEIKMPRATSMLEMNTIHDMVEFGQAMDALSCDESSGEDGVKNVLSQDTQDDDEGFFIDTEDDANVTQLSSSPDCVGGLPPQARETAKPSFGGSMRRVMSVASLSSRSRFSVPATLQDMNPIAEEPAAEVPKISTINSIKKNVQQYGKTGALDSSNHSMLGLDISSHSISSQSDRTNSQNRRPSRRSSGMPPRSSLKGSSNNLRSSLKSTTSVESEVSGESTTRSNSTSNNMKRNVSFSSLEIRSYNVTLGDAPTSYGPPVSLDWEYDPSATADYSVDDYEEYREWTAPRRTKGEMLMPPMHRQYLLMREAGFTKGEIGLAMEEAKRVARRREKTKKMDRMGLAPVEEALEKTKRRWRKLGGRVAGGGN